MEGTVDRAGPSQRGHGHHQAHDAFEHFAHRVSDASGRPTAFVAAVTIIVVWAATGPLFGFNQTWQLVINTGTTIVTFLMVFLIQSMQNRDTDALHIKLDELLRVMAAADNRLIEVENADELTIDELKHRFQSVAESGQPPEHG
jgi:low affinity Fe/Cu permease